MSEIVNIQNAMQPTKLQPKEPKEARNITPTQSDAVRPNETNNVKVVSLSASPKVVDETQDPLLKAAKLVEQFIPVEDTAPNTKLRIDRDESSGDFIYQSIDKESGEVIAQFPSEKILKMLSYYREAEGIAVDENA